mmetsp:Transcript_39512/g.99609  ORF Transcript_39512/g.99609 Transcript_39512/m.99609 type:complete len:185 (+) Transcript_39512:88-642(+)
MASVWVVLALSLAGVVVCGAGHKCKNPVTVAVDWDAYPDRTWYTPYTTYRFWKGKNCADAVLSKWNSAGKLTESQHWWEGSAKKEMDGHVERGEEGAGRFKYSMVKLGVEVLHVPTFAVSSARNNTIYGMYYCRTVAGVTVTEGFDVRSTTMAIADEDLQQILSGANAAGVKTSHLFPAEYTDC